MALVELDSRQQIPPQAFAPMAERRMLPTARSVARRFLEHRAGGVLLNEFAGPYGRVDFLLAMPDADALKARRESGLRALQVMSEVRLVSTLSHRYARAPETVAMESGLASSSVVRVAKTLAREGHVMVLEDGRLRRHQALVPVVKTASFEVKVDDWQAAIRQARTYALWNRWSTVVLETARNRDGLIEAAKRRGLGVAVGENLIVRPRAQDVKTYLHLLTSETFLVASGNL